MTALKTIDRLAAKKLHEEMNAAIRASTHLAAFAKKYGLKITPANAGYDATKFTLKVEAKIENAAVRADLIQLAAMVGFDASGTSLDGRYKVVEYGRGKMPWRMEVVGNDTRSMKAADGWMKKNFPPAKDGQAPKVTVSDNLIVKG